MYEELLNKLVFYFQKGYNCLPFNLAFSDEFLNLSGQENSVLEKVIDDLISKELVYRNGLELCLTQKGRKWIETTESVEEKIKQNVEVSPLSLLNMLVAFYKIDKQKQEKVIRILLNKVNNFRNIEEILKEFENIIGKI